MSTKKAKDVVVLRRVTKQFDEARGVFDISLKVPQGSIYGFLGPNGAGKTTTINMMVNLTRPTSGRLQIFGLDSQQHGTEIRRKIGFVSGDMALDGVLTGRQQLEYFAQLRGVNAEEKITELAERLQCDLTRKIKTLSRGNRQKVALIAALMHQPELLVLDEPTSGLDPIMQNECNKLILEHQKNGGTTFISSHILSEVQELCDRVAFIREGRLIVDTSLKDIVQGAPKILRVTSRHDDVPKQLSSLPGISEITTDGVVVGAQYNGDITPLLRRLSNLDLEDIVIEDADLEDIFSTYYEVDHVS